MSYAQIREKVRLLIEGDDIGNTFNTDTLDLLISFGENRVYRNLRADTMRTISAPITPVANIVAIPADLLQLTRVIVGTRDVEIIDEWRMQALLDSSATAQDTLFCAHNPDGLIFFPENTADVTLHYYAKPASLASAGESTTYNRYPEVFLFAAVAESAPFLGEDARIQIWEGKFQQYMADADQNERWRVNSGSPLRTRVR
jgi:hypothetical protein